MTRRLPAPTPLGFALLLTILLLALGLALAVGRAGADEPDPVVRAEPAPKLEAAALAVWATATPEPTPTEAPRYSPSSRGTRPAVTHWRPLLEQYDWDVDTALRVIDCESGGDPDVWNRQGSGAHGLWQLLGWEHLAYELYGVWDVSDPAINTHVAYLLYLAGGRRFDTSIGWRASVGCWS